MSYRATETEVRKIITDIAVGADLTPFIAAANELVTEICADEYTETRLTMIENWLAAHFYSVANPQAASESAGGVGTSYRGSTGLNLDVTVYGQQVKLLDTQGLFAALNKQAEKGVSKRVGVNWLGTETSTVDDVA